MEPKNLLVRMPNWIGDLVMATPVLADLRNAFPEAKITAMCRKPIHELLMQDPSIDDLFSFTKWDQSFLRRESRDVIGSLLLGKFDVTILLTNSFSSAWIAWQAKIKRRIGYKDHGRRFLLTDPIDKPKAKMHQVDLYKKLLEPLGISRSKTTPKITLLEKEIEESKTLLYQRGYRKGERLIGINPGAAYGSAKCWPPEKFRELGFLLAKEGWVLFFGDSTSSAMIKEITAEMPANVINLAGLTSLRELACLISDCDLLITNDSGPMHIGAALGTKLIALFGSTDEELTGPYQVENSVIRKKVSCSPCFKRECPIDFRCMKQIEVKEVFEKARDGLKHV
jgi:heptosyltransferase-2